MKRLLFFLTLLLSAFVMHSCSELSANDTMADRTITKPDLQMSTLATATTTSYVEWTDDAMRPGKVHIGLDLDCSDTLALCYIQQGFWANPNSKVWITTDTIFSAETDGRYYGITTMDLEGRGLRVYVIGDGDDPALSSGTVAILYRPNNE